MLNIRPMLVVCSMCLVLALASPVLCQDHPPSDPPKVTVQPDGTVDIPAQSAPVSTFLSPEAKAYLTQHLKDMQDAEILKQDAGIPRFMKPYIARDHEFASAISAILHDPPKHSAMRQAARAYALNASWDSVFEGVYAAYAAMLNAGAADSLAG